MHLTDKQIKEIIADYTECGSYRETGRRFGVSANTVKHYVQNDAQFVQKCAEKKEQNTKDVLAFMERKKDKACRIIDTYLDKMLEPEKIEKMTGQQLATSLAIIIDKFSGNTGPSADDLKVNVIIKDLTKDGSNAT